MIADLRPYLEYKDSGSHLLGSVPTSWDVRSLRSLVRRRNERDRPDLPLLSVAREKGVFVRSLTDLSENHNVIPEDLSNYKVARAGNLVINKMKAWQGSMGIAPCDGIVSPAYFVFDLWIDNGMFAQRLLRSKPYVAHFARASDGVRVGQWDLSIPVMRQIPVLLPPRDEQEAIVRFLDWASGLLELAVRSKRKVIALLNEQKQAIIHSAVTRGLDATSSVRASGVASLPDIPSSWRMIPLKFISSVQSGLTLGKVYENSGLVEHPYLRVANVQAGRLALGKVKSIKVPSEDAKRCLLRVGDVLMTEGGDPDKLGRGCVWDGEIEACLHQNHVFAVRPRSEDLLPAYLAILLESRYARDYFQMTSKQTTNLASTNKSTIGRFRVPLPNLTEQLSILASLAISTNPIDRTISRMESEIDLLRTYRARLIADVVTGKLDVRGAAAKLPDVTSTGLPETDEEEVDPEEIDEEAGA